MLIDEQGRLYHDDPYDKDNWLTYGAAIYAPGDGTIVACENNVPDNSFEGKHIKQAVPEADFTGSLGNYVVINHGDGEFSVIPHMQRGSVMFKAGDPVRQGQKIGRVGFSGDALFPHVHYALINGADIARAEGLPTYFTRFRRLLGSGARDEHSSNIDSGDIVQSAALYERPP